VAGRLSRRVRARHVEDVPEFTRLASPLLMTDEARHNLLLGIIGRLRDAPDEYREHHLWLVEEDGSVVGAAAMTPPYNLVVSRPLDGRALQALAEAIRSQGVAVPGVLGAVPEVHVFAEAWTKGEGMSRLQMSEGIYRLTEVRPVEGVPGRLRPAEPSDRQLLVDWIRAFSAEANPEAPGIDDENWVDRRLRGLSGTLHVWEDGGPVSMAGQGSATPNGARIGPVYTPPDLRRKGYASALVAGVSDIVLAGGKRFCYLFTDLSNPTSNKIYRDVGYELWCEAASIAFEGGSG
jgi:uncharacterized protein